MVKRSHALSQQHEKSSSITPSRRIAVIGAGMSGLAAAKSLLDEKLVLVVLEQATEIGGVWKYHEELPTGGGVMYRSLRANTSRQTFAFSDFPLPASLPDYPAYGAHAEGARVLVVARSAEPLKQLAVAFPGVLILALDATSEDAPAQVFETLAPDVLVVCAGAIPHMAPLVEQNFEQFSRNWNSDVKMSLLFSQPP